MSVPPEPGAYGVRRKPIPRPMNRRLFLARLALASAGTPALGAFLAGCGQSDEAVTTTPAAAQPTVASPARPITWPISAENPLISANGQPERNATLRLFNYPDYIGPEVLRSFEKKYRVYNVKVVVDEFANTDEALNKIRTGTVPYDVYFPSYDQIGKMVRNGVIRPLQHRYLPNIKNVWPCFTDPWYDGEWRYTVPYSVYTTGIGWRADLVPENVAALANPYDALWDVRLAGKVAVIDDWHTAMAFALLRMGFEDVNTGDAHQASRVQTQMLDMKQTMHPEVTVSAYTELPAGKLALAQMWSGDVVNATSYLPPGVNRDVLRYWFPADGKGMVDNDLMVILRGGKNPVLAHLFLNHMLAVDTSLANFSYIGYQPPQRSINPSRLVAEGYLPANLASTTVKKEYFQTGYRLLELPDDIDLRWHMIWQEFKRAG